MSRTTKGSKGPGYDFWKRRMRYSAMCGYGSAVKRDTNRLARRVCAKLLSVGRADEVELMNFRQRGMTPT